MSKHPRVKMKKNTLVEITEPKYVELHKDRCFCECSNIVLNLMGDKRVWTRVKFDCGEMIKINCNVLKKV